MIIPELVNYFIDEFSRGKGWRRKKINDDAMKVLQSYTWPGNVRELRNAVERLMIMTDSEIIGVSDMKNMGIIRESAKERNLIFLSAV